MAIPLPYEKITADWDSLTISVPYSAEVFDLAANLHNILWKDKLNVRPLTESSNLTQCLIGINSTNGHRIGFVRFAWPHPGHKSEDDVTTYIEVRAENEALKYKLTKNVIEHLDRGRFSVHLDNRQHSTPYGGSLI